VLIGFRFLLGLGVGGFARRSSCFVWVHRVEVGIALGP